MIPKHLKVRITVSLAKIAAKHKLTQKAQKAIIKELNSDLILPSLNLRKNSKVSVLYDEHDGADCRDDEDAPSVEVQIGPRDWSFDAKTGECFGAGTCLV